MRSYKKKSYTVTSPNGNHAFSVEATSVTDALNAYAREFGFNDYHSMATEKRWGAGEWPDTRRDDSD